MTCDGCRYWSELIAACDGCDGLLRAACLNTESIWYGKWAYVGCNDRVAGRAIDDPSPIAGEIESER